MSIFRTARLIPSDWSPLKASCYQKMRMRFLCAILLPALLTACSGPTSTPGVTSADTSGQKTIAAVNATAPPGADNRPLKPGASGTEYTPDGLPALQPARGINADMLFAEKINDSNARFDRLETAVTDIRREFDSVKPAIVRLVAVEQDMQALLTQLETLVQNPPTPVENVSLESLPPPAISPPVPTPQAMSAPVPIQPAPAEKMPEPLATSPPVPVPVPAVSATPTTAHNGMVKVQGLRIGEHGNMTRLVIDLSGPVSYKQDLDNAENLLVVELPGADWIAKASGTLNNSPLVQSWSAQRTEDGQGSRLIINLKKSVKISQESSLVNPHRIVIDLQAGN